jgi:hypothetical protein
VGYRAIVSALAHLGLIDAPDPEPMTQVETLHLCDVADRWHAGDVFAKPWSSFDRVSAGDLIGTRQDRTPVVTSLDGHIVFPNADAGVGQEWFYLAQPSDRLRC